jgi:hypothetical protein
VQLACPSCGTLYDVSGYPAGHAFTCSCGRALTVPEPPVPAAPGAAGPVLAGEAAGAPAQGGAIGAPDPAGAIGPADRGADPGLDGWVKVLVFLANLCSSPLVGLVSWVIVRTDRPRTAAQICTLTWIPVVLWAVFVFLAVIVSLIGGA